MDKNYETESETEDYVETTRKRNLGSADNRNRNRPARKPFAQQSPDEVKEAIKEKVSKGVATVAGVVEGFNESMDEGHIPERTKEAIQKAGLTVRNVAETTTDEARQTIESVKKGKGKGSDPSLGSSRDSGLGSTRDLGSSQWSGRKDKGVTDYGSLDSAGSNY